MYIGAVAVLPTYVEPTVTLLGRELNGIWQASPGQQERRAGAARGDYGSLLLRCVALRLVFETHALFALVQFAAMFFGVACMFLVA